MTFEPLSPRTLSVLDFLRVVTELREQVIASEKPTELTNAMHALLQSGIDGSDDAQAFLWHATQMHPDCLLQFGMELGWLLHEAALNKVTSSEKLN